MWIVCSRNRPHLVQRIFSKVTPSTPGLIAIDADQEALYSDVKLPPGWRIDVSAKNYFGPKNNDVLARYPDEPFYGSMNDDMMPETPGWDSVLRDAAGSWGIAWADDCLGKRAGCLAFGGKLIRSLGFICAPGIKHFFNDSAHETIAEDLGIGVFRSEIKVPHLHFSNSKAKFDDTYKGRPDHKSDSNAFMKWKTQEWPTLRAKVKEEMAGC